MIYLRQLLRLFNIYRIIIRYGLDELILSTHLFRPLRLFLYFTPGYWMQPKDLTRGERIRMALEELGPIFVKFGQILSVRRDLLPDDIAVELAKLQDNVGPFSGIEAKQIIEKAYNCKIEAVFDRFDTEPLAAASIAQVHAARLKEKHEEVVVKVLRPNIENRISRDVEFLYMLARLINRYWTESRRFHPVEVVAEFEKNLHDELDLMQEAANCSTLRRNFEKSAILYVPQVEWDYCKSNVMVVERIGGLSVSDVETLKRHGVNLRYLAQAGVEIFFTQVFRHNFFHADMHPGNIFVDIHDPNRPYYVAVDFGIMGSLSAQDQHYLAANLLAFFHRNYRKVAELHVDSGWVPASTRVEEFEGAIRGVCEPIFNRPIKDISFGLLLLRLFQTARRFNMEVQPQLVLLQKTLLNIEGLGRQLYPELDLWTSAKPYLEEWMNEQIGVRGFVKGMWTNLPIWAEKLPEIPLLIHEHLNQRQNDTTHFKQMTQELESLRREMQRQHQRNGLILAGSALLLCASVILALEVQITWNMPFLGTLLGIVGSAMLLVAWINFP